MLKHIIIYCLIWMVNSPLAYMQNWEQVGLGGAAGVRCLFADTLHNKLVATGKLWASNGIDTLQGVLRWMGNEMEG